MESFYMKKLTFKNDKNYHERNAVGSIGKSVT